MLQSLSSEERAVLRKLARRSDLRAFLTILADWSVVLLAAAVSEAAFRPWLYALAVMVIARQMNALFELHHHAIHANMERATRLALDESAVDVAHGFVDGMRQLVAAPE